MARPAAAAFAPAFAFALTAAALLAPGARADTIELTLDHGAAAGEAALTWISGTSPYQVHRADAPQAVVSPAHLLGLATSGVPGLSDPSVPAAGDVYFYVVVSGACGDGVVDLGEGCDDGGAAPGDGCSSACQVETPAALALTPGFEAFGEGFVGSPGAAAPFQVQNQGDMAAGPVSIGLVAGDTADFEVLPPIAGDCVPDAPLAGHASCTVRARFAPQSPGPKTATLRASATPGGAPQATLTGIAEWPLTLTVPGSGVVTIDGVPACGGGCPEVTGHPDGAVLSLVAAPQNGAGHYFSGWSGDCSGTGRTCTVTMDQARSVTATFSPLDHNLAFVSSVPLRTDLGSATAYDTQCNTLATAAGINSGLGNAWIAWISTGASTPQARLGPTARGWERVDGKPVADAITALQASGVIHHPIRLDEYGVDVGARQVMTGTTNAGAANATCQNWTTTTSGALVTVGDAASGSGGWSSLPLNTNCATMRSVYCLMRTITVPLVISPEAGKRIFLSGPFTPNLATTPDARCEADKPAGMGSVKAFVATTTTSADAALAPAQRYVRPDGIFIGTGADLAAGALLTSGLWQLATGAYAADNTFAWTGAPSPGVVGSAASTCSNWTSTASTGQAGRVTSTDAAWWNAGTTSCASAAIRLYCVEQ